jgi:hypothetical protein
MQKLAKRIVVLKRRLREATGVAAVVLAVFGMTAGAFGAASFNASQFDLRNRQAQPLLMPVQASDPLRSLIGKVYEDPPSIPGWTDQGGGLLESPVWYSQYQRNDGAILVVANWAMPMRPGAKHTPFLVTDVLTLPPLANNQELNFDCRVVPENVARKIFAVVRPNPKQQREWWRDIVQAWAISLNTGLIERLPVKGIECRNESWGL